MLISLALVFVQALLPLLGLYLVKRTIDAITASLSAPDRAAAFKQVMFWIILSAAVALVTALARLVSGLVSEIQSLAVTDHMHEVIQRKSIAVDLEYYEDSGFFDKLHRAQQEASFRPSRVVTGIYSAGESALSLGAMAGLLFTFHWGGALLLFLASLPGILVRLKYSRRLFSWYRDSTPVERSADYYNWMLTGDVYAKELRQYGLGDLFRERFKGLRSVLRRELLQMVSRRTVAELATQTAVTLALFGSMVFLAWRTVSGGLTLGDMVMYFAAFQRGVSSLGGLLSALAGLYEDNLFLTSLYEFLDLEPRVREPVRALPFPRPITTGIVFDRVGFRYPNDSREVLSGISLEIRPGEVVALVGENGSGKSTLVKLLCRLYDPQEGSIRIDGIDLRQFETSALRGEIGVVYQDFAQYYLSARENIRFGDLKATDTDARIAPAARRSGADRVISRLPQGLDTILGKWFAEGVELSVGEWQKMALARAFMRDAQIVVLDEPTAALDAATEHSLLQSFRELTVGKMALVISHRFSTVRMADRIYVLDQGIVAESGSHQELIKLGCLYAEMFRKQAQPYIDRSL